MLVPSFTDTLTREGTSVLMRRTPASGAPDAGVKDGPLEIVKAGETTGIARIAVRTKAGLYNQRNKDGRERGDNQ